VVKPVDDPTPINPTPRHEELGVLLQQELDPNLDYYDATASIKAMAEEMRRQAAVQRVIAEHQVTLGSSLITCHAKILELAATVNRLTDIVNNSAEISELPAGSPFPGPRSASPILPGRHPLRKE
jgi:hypothetical protein